MLGFPISFYTNVRSFLSSFEDKICFALSSKIAYTILGTRLVDNLSEDQYDALRYLTENIDQDCYIAMPPASGRSLVASLFHRYLLSKGISSCIIAPGKGDNYFRMAKKLKFSCDEVLGLKHTLRQIPSCKYLIVDVTGVCDINGAVRKDLLKRVEKRGIKLCLIEDTDYMIYSENVFYKMVPYDECVRTRFELISAKSGNAFSYLDNDTTVSEILKELLTLSNCDNETGFIDECLCTKFTSFDRQTCAVGHYTDDVEELEYICSTAQVPLIDLRASDIPTNVTRLIILGRKYPQPGNVGRYRFYNKLRETINRLRRRSFNDKEITISFIVKNSSCEEASFALSFLVSQRELLASRIAKGLRMKNFSTLIDKAEAGVGVKDLAKSVYPAFIRAPTCDDQVFNGSYFVLENSRLGVCDRVSYKRKRQYEEKVSNKIRRIK